MDNSKTKTYEIQHHLGNPKLCRVKGLKLTAMPECEGGGWFTDEKTANILANALNGELQDDVVRLVVAAREVFDIGYVGPDFKELDKAVEAFSERVPYDR